VIGDIHGCRDLLERLLARLGDMPVLVLGDVVDRGSDARGVVDALVARGASGVLGNHEEWLLAWLRGEGFDSFALKYWMGGDATLASYGVAGRTPRLVEAETWRVPAEHRAWLESLALVVDLDVQGERYWLIHAGIPSHLDLTGVPVRGVVPWIVEHHPRTLRWSVTRPDDAIPADRCVVMGHVPLAEPVDLGHVIAIDTGAGTLADEGRLTAVVLPDRRFVTVGPGEPLG
jgi:serine/threonine protein phosphatase 1